MKNPPYFFVIKRVFFFPFRKFFVAENFIKTVGFDFIVSNANNFIKNSGSSTLSTKNAKTSFSHNLKQMAATVTAYQQYGFSSPEELDEACSAAYAAMQESLSLIHISST